MWADVWKSKIPEGESGNVRVQRMEVTPSAAAISLFSGAHVPPGNYTALRIGEHLVMSDTPKEFSDHRIFFCNASGHVLINGLGLGCALNVIQNIESVVHITVIEKNEHVIELVGPHFEDVEIIHEDAFDYKPPKGVRYGAVWHDIWADICTDNLPEMHRLHRKYGRRTDWQGSWSRSECEYHKRHGR